MAVRTSPQGGPNPSASLRARCLIFLSLSFHTSHPMKQVSYMPRSATPAPTRAQVFHPYILRCRKPRGFISSRTKSRHVMVKTAQAVLIFFSLSASSPSSLPFPHSSSEKSESLSDLDGESSSLPLPPNQKDTPPPLLIYATSRTHPPPTPTTLPRSCSSPPSLPGG